VQNKKINMKFKPLLLMFIAAGILQACFDKNQKSSLQQVKMMDSRTDDSIFNINIQQYGHNFRVASTREEKEKWLIKAIEYSHLPGKESFKDIFVKEMLKLNPKHKNSADYLWYWGSRLQDMMRQEDASIIFKGFINRFPSDLRRSEAEKYIITEQKDIHRYINDRLTRLKHLRQDSLGLIMQKSYVQLIEALALSFPEDVNTPKYLISYAEVSGKMGDISGAISGFDWVLQYYPESSEAPMALFLKGFYFENHFNNKIEAENSYKLFLEKYPDHYLAKDVDLLIKSLNKPVLQ
jgi:tetratricopeptide (TPR) repeat protein